MSKHLTLCLVVVLVMAFLAPMMTYLYLTNNDNFVIGSYRKQIIDLQQQVDNLTEQNRQLSLENSQLTNLTKPYLITSLGWYLHRSDDPVARSRNTFTIYGTMFNVGQATASNVELTIKFFGNDDVLQTSTIQVGIIPSMRDNIAHLKNLPKTSIDCPVADSVTDIDVSLNYQ